MVFSHESFTHPYASSGLEVHGTKGSILARGVLSQEPAGEIELITAQGTTRVDYDHSGLYENVVRNFCAAVAGLIRSTRCAARSGSTGWRRRATCRFRAS